MKVVSVFFSIGLVLAETYGVRAQNHLFPPLPEGECGEEALKPDGLTAIFNEFSETFPTFEFLGTFLEALSDDEEVVRVLSLLLTDDFNNLINKVGDIDEWVEITDIFCDDLQFNVNFSLKVIGDLFKVNPIDPSTSKSENRTRPGVMGLLRDIVDILPLSEWQVKLNDLIEQNEAFRIAIDTVKADLSKAVVIQTCQMDEFRTLVNNLRSVGLPVACGMTQLEKILGWPYGTCECGDTRTSNTWGPHAKEFISDLGKRISIATNEKRSTLYLQQRLSIDIQHGNSTCVMGTLPSTNSLDEIFYLLTQPKSN